MRAPSWCRPGSTPPGCRTPFHRLKVDCITVMLAGPVTVFDRRLPVYSRRSPFLSADRALNPEPPAYKAVALTSWGYRIVGHLGVEPSYTALSERPLRPDGPWPSSGSGASRTPRAVAQPGSTRPVHHVRRKDGHFRAHAMRSVPLRDAAAGDSASP
jgi:hypothetical protein